MPSRPKRDLTVDEIVDRAIEITGTDGGESSLTMRALASACGVTPMALYRHVDDKETLLTLIVDRVVGDAIADFGGRRRRFGGLDDAPAVRPDVGAPR